MDGRDADNSKQSTDDMTAFVQNLLQQMQTRFQAMSESIISKNDETILAKKDTAQIEEYELFMGHHKRVDEMGNRIDELEQSINDLRAEMGQEGNASPSAPSKTQEEPKSADGDS